MTSFALKLAISAGLVWWLASRQELADLTERATSLSVAGAALIVALLLMQSVAATIRWGWITTSMGYAVPMRSLLRAWLIGQFLGQGFPSTIGHDAYRVLNLRRHGVPIQAALQIIIVDRFTGVVALLVIAAATMPLLYGLTENKAALIPICLAVVGGLVAAGLMFTRLPTPFSQSGGRVIRLVESFRSGLRELVATKHAILWLVAPAILAHLFSVFAAYCIARDGDAQFGFAQLLAVIPTSLLVSLIPFSISGWGIREGAMVAGGLLVGVSAADALFVSVTLGLGFLAVGLIGGLIWLLSHERTLVQKEVVERPHE